MAAQPEESAQSADLQAPELGHKDGTATEMQSNQGGHKLPHPHHYISWKECFHEKVQQRCLSLQETKMRLVQTQKAEEAKVRRREPGDCLARDWYNEEEKTLDTRLYLLDNLLPTLIPGAENLLLAVERNHVLVSDQDPTRFKPTNYLAEYLMRHNPQYSAPTKPGPYLREMEAVSEELKSLRQGPIIELQDINLIDFWGSLDDQEVCEEVSVSLIWSETEISEAENLEYESVDDDRQETDRMSTSVTEGAVEEKDMSETETGGISKEENEAAEPSVPEVSKEGEEAISAVESTGLEAADLDGEPGSGKAEEAILGSEPETETKPEEDYTSDREPGSEGQVSREGSGVTGASREGTSTGASGEGAVTDTDATDSQQAMKETSASESQSDQQTTSETRLHDQDSASSVAEIQDHQDPCSFAASCLTLPQFVQLMDNFVGEDISLPTLKRLIAFMKREFKQTAEEKIKQREKIHRFSHMAQRKHLLEALFEKWDSKACGSLDLEEVITVLSTFKGHKGKEALMEAKEEICSQYPQLSKVGKITPKAFQIFLELIASKFTGNEDETMDNLVSFLTTSVEQSHIKSLQSSARRKWLQDIQKAAETSGTNMEPVYKAVIKALYQDMEAHGNNKTISAYIALLEENQLSPEQGQVLLRYMACTADNAPYILNRVLHREMKGISFAAIDQGKPIYVPRVQHHGNIHFWSSDDPEEEKKGSLLVLPLHDAHWRVFGILGLDTLWDQTHTSIFLTHEITFYEGVCHAFSKAYHHICMREHVLQVAVTALDWLYPRTPSIHAVTIYLVEPGTDKNYVLCKMITTDNTGQKEIYKSPVILLREENILRGYLFKCTDSSEVTLTSIYGERHIAVPLHDLSRHTLGIFDISIGEHKKLPPQEQKDLQKMLKMAQAACSEILQRFLEEREPTQVLEAEHVTNVRHAGILFHRFMLQDLRECVLKLGAESFDGIKSWAEPPALVYEVLKAVLLLLHPDWKSSEDTECWTHCKMKLDDNLIQEIYCFDPTASSVQVEAELLLDLIAAVFLFQVSLKHQSGSSSLFQPNTCTSGFKPAWHSWRSQRPNTLNKTILSPFWNLLCLQLNLLISHLTLVILVFHIFY
ncbi:EF-hand calcium-binding domain-containing protein 5 [Ammospiza maritima maritima]